VTPALMYRLAKDQERTEFADNESRAGDPVKWSACECTDHLHGFPDRSGWMQDQESAYADQRRAENDGRHGVHVVKRETRRVA